MKAQSLFIKVLMVVFAVIGLLVVLATLGMSLMHVGMMKSIGTMITECRIMMTALP